MEIGSATKIYVAGCGGMLGDAVYRELASVAVVRASDLRVDESWLVPLDVRDAEAVRAELTAFAPDLVINLAALTDLEACERDEADAFRTNTEGARNMGAVAHALGVPYVLVSSAGVFSGASDVFTESDTPVPLGVYARSKVDAEAWVTANVTRHYVVRAGWMMGGGPRKDKKFVNKIYRQIRAGARSLDAVHDKLGTPTYTVDLARGIRALVETGRFGLYHHACTDAASRYDVAVAFVDALGLSERVRVRAVGSEHFERDYFAPRPTSEKLSSAKLAALGVHTMRPWRTCLTEYAAEFRADLERDSLFELLGGESAIRRLAESFYDAVDAHEPSLARLHPTDAAGRVARSTRDRFAAFLVEWLGGPAHYSSLHGHRGLQASHRGVAVDLALRDAWLRAMTRALDACAIEGTTRSTLDERFRDAADRLLGAEPRP